MGRALDVVTRTVTAFDAGDEATVLAGLHPDVVLTAPGEVSARGRSAAVAYSETFLSAFSELEVDVHLLAEHGDTVVEEYTLTATHTGTHLTSAGTFPPTGRRITLRVAEFYRVRDDLITENRLYYDEAALERQLRGRRTVS